MAEKANEFLLITVTGLLEHVGVLPPAQAQLVLLQRFVAADCFNLGDDDVDDDGDDDSDDDDGDDGDDDIYGDDNLGNERETIETFGQSQSS